MLAPTVGFGYRHVVVVGAGGNIGSHLVPHLARLPEIGHLTLIDRDRYAVENLATQAIVPAAVHQRKATVQGRLARRINPRLLVTALAEPVEQVPLGRLRADLILGCLDSRRSRQYLNEAALRLGVPLLDAGVLADGLLARLDAYAPGADAPCLECGWSNQDYAALEQTYPCGTQVEALPTAAPSGLGALAAALQAIECQKHLSGNASADALSAGEQLVVGAGTHRHFRTSNRRNPGCRMGSHAAWVIEPVPVDFGATSLAALLDRVAGPSWQTPEFCFSVFGKAFVTDLVCSQCGTTRQSFRLAGALRASERACPRCGDSMAITGFGMARRVRPAHLSPAALRLPLGRLGLRSGEVISIADRSGERHFELTAGRTEETGE